MKKDKLQHLIVGYGEVGNGLSDVLYKKTNVWIFDPGLGFSFKELGDGRYYDVIHICIPYGKEFSKVVLAWKKNTTKGGMVIVHSTVPVGTCDKLKVIHSPIRGVHPNLGKGIKTFVKYFGGKDAMKAALMFKKYGCKVLSTNKARDTEALKLWDTAQYGWQIVLMKEIHRWCKENRVDFDFVYRIANAHYNDGYKKLGRPEVVRPFLFYKKGKIGGHCIIPNLEMLPGSISSVIKFRNKKY